MGPKLSWLSRFMQKDSLELFLSREMHFWIKADSRCLSKSSESKADEHTIACVAWLPKPGVGPSDALTGKALLFC